MKDKIDTTKVKEVEDPKTWIMDVTTRIGSYMLTGT
jgi:hypothetical protein